MTSFEEILKKSSYPELKSFCNENNLALGEQSEDNEYRFTIVSKDLQNQNACSGYITNDKVVIFISDKDNNIIEDCDSEYKTTESLFDIMKTSIETFQTISKLNLDTEKEISNESVIIKEDEQESVPKYSSVIEAMADIRNKLETIADDFISAAELTYETELKANLVSLSNSALSLAMEIDDNVELYEELQETENEEEDDIDLETEQKLRYDASRSLVAVKKLCMNGKTNKSDVQKFESFLKKMLK